MAEVFEMRLIDAPAFSFSEPARACGFWSDGRHIVAAGECRCGMKFVLAEHMARPLTEHEHV